MNKLTGEGFANWLLEHYGPGPHPKKGSPQAAHAGGGGGGGGGGRSSGSGGGKGRGSSAGGGGSSSSGGSGGGKGRGGSAAAAAPSGGGKKWQAGDHFNAHHPRTEPQQGDQIGPFTVKQVLQRGLARKYVLSAEGRPDVEVRGSGSGQGWTFDGSDAERLNRIASKMGAKNAHNGLAGPAQRPSAWRGKSVFPGQKIGKGFTVESASSYSRAGSREVVVRGPNNRLNKVTVKKGDDGKWRLDEESAADLDDQVQESVSGFANWLLEHYGPGPHPKGGTPQMAHAGGRKAAAMRAWAGKMKSQGKDAGAEWTAHMAKGQRQATGGKGEGSLEGTLYKGARETAKGMSSGEIRSRLRDAEARRKGPSKYPKTDQAAGAAALRDELRSRKGAGGRHSAGEVGGKGAVGKVQDVTLKLVVRGRHTERKVKAEVKGELALHQSLGGGGFSITHVQSGMSVVNLPTSASLDDARKAFGTISDGWRSMNGGSKPEWHRSGEGVGARSHNATLVKGVLDSVRAAKAPKNVPAAFSERERKAQAKNARAQRSEAERAATLERMSKVETQFIGPGRTEVRTSGVAPKSDRPISAGDRAARSRITHFGVLAKWKGSDGKTKTGTVLRDPDNGQLYGSAYMSQQVDHLGKGRGVKLLTAEQARSLFKR